MPPLSGFVPTGQEVHLSGRLGSFSADLVRRRRRRARRGLVGFVLLVLGFCLLILGGTMPMPQVPAMAGHMAGSLTGEPIGTVASLVGRSPAETVQLLWNQGIRITGVQQSIGEIAEANGRSAHELLNLLVPPEPSSPLLID